MCASCRTQWVVDLVLRPPGCVGRQLGGIPPTKRNLCKVSALRGQPGRSPFKGFPAKFLLHNPTIVDNRYGGRSPKNT